MSGYKNQKFGLGTERRNYQKTSGDLKLGNLLDIQKEGFKKFIEHGIDEVFNEIYPISSSKDKIKIEFVKSHIKLPKNYEEKIAESRAKGSNFFTPLKATFKMINNITGEVKTDDSVFIADIPLMTNGGSFIINGSERIIISQIIRSPGAYFESMKASRAQTVSDSSVYKIATLIPSRGAWIEWNYKDYALLGLPVQDIKLKIDKSKKIKAGLLFYALGLSEHEVLNLYGNHELVTTTLGKVNKTERETYKARETIFKFTNPGDRATQRATNESLPNIFFNKKRYDLSPTGRYKLNKKLSIVNRIIDKVLAEDLRDSKGNVLFKKFTLVNKDVATEILNHQEKNNLELTKLPIDPVLFESIGIENFEQQSLFANVVVAKVFASKDYKENGTIVHVVGNTHSNLEFLTISDILSTFGYFINLEQGILPRYDDIDSLENRKIRGVDELLKNQFRIGLTKIEKNVKERISQKDITGITIKSVTNYKVMESTLKEFFNTSQLSQFMDQVNPLAEISNKRRITSLGPGGLSRDTASLVVRGIHDTHYGRIDPIETPEGPNIGLILNLALYARTNKYGLLETPYFKVQEGKILRNKVVYLTAEDEEIEVIASGIVKVNENDEIIDKNVIARKGGKFVNVNKKEITLVDVSPKQIVSIASSHIPFLENNDANRALMGANMQRQAVPLIKAEAPIVGTGVEQDSAYSSPTTLKSYESGTVVSVDSAHITIENNEGKKTKYTLEKFARSNQATSINQIPRVEVGQKIKEGQIIADGPSVDNGELAIGKNILVAFTTWRGYNYEDAIIISERLLKEDTFTSIHIEEHKIEVRETKLGEEKITRDIPNASKEAMRNLDEEGIIVVGSEVKVGDVLVGKVTPKTEEDLSPEEKLLDAILGYKSKNIKDSSLRVPYGQEGVVQDVKVLSIANGDKLDDGVIKLIKVYIVQKRKIKEGDKMSGRHGNKGVISRVLPAEDMPYLEDGTPIDIMLNPLGVPSRMNIGQVLEIHLGMAAKKLGLKVATPIFNGANEKDLKEILSEAKIDPSGKFQLTDGITGEKFKDKVAVGIMYMLKLSHMVDDKMHARSIGPYSLITQQPLRGKSQNGGQRFGEMEAWALEAYGASNLLQEMITLKSDDIQGRNELYNSIARGKKLPTPNIPEGFWVLYYELRGLGLDFEFLDENSESFEIGNSI